MSNQPTVTDAELLRAMLPVATTPENPERHEVLASGYAATAPQMQSAPPPDDDAVPVWLDELNASAEVARQDESEASDGQ